MFERLKSRKFWMAVVTGGLVVANHGLDLGLPEDAVQTVAATVMAYVLGQGIADAGNRKS